MIVVLALVAVFSVSEVAADEAGICVRVTEPDAQSRKFWWIELTADGRLREYMSTKIRGDEYNDARLRTCLQREAKLGVFVIIFDSKDVSIDTMTTAIDRLERLSPAGIRPKITVQVLSRPRIVEESH